MITRQKTSRQKYEKKYTEAWTKTSKRNLRGYACSVLFVVYQKSSEIWTRQKYDCDFYQEFWRPRYDCCNRKIKQKNWLCTPFVIDWGRWFYKMIGRECRVAWNITSTRNRWYDKNFPYSRTWKTKITRSTGMQIFAPIDGIQMFSTAYYLMPMMLKNWFHCISNPCQTSQWWSPEKNAGTKEKISSHGWQAWLWKD